MAQTQTKKIKLPPVFQEALRLARALDVNTAIVHAEGGKIWTRSLSMDRMKLLEFSMPGSFLPAGTWEIDVSIAARAKEAWIEGDVLTSPVGEVGKRADGVEDLPLPKIEFTIRAVVDAEVIRALARTGQDTYDAIAGFRAANGKLLVGTWDLDGRMVAELPQRLASSKGEGAIYLKREDLKIPLPQGSVRLEWSEEKPLRMSFSNGGADYRIWIAPASEHDYARWDQPHAEAPSARLTKEDWEVLSKAGGVLKDGMYIVDLEDATYCAQLNLRLPGTWGIGRVPRLDLAYLLGAPRVYTIPGLLYFEGWVVGHEGEYYAECPPPPAGGTTLSPGVVEQLRAAHEVVFKSDGLYVVQKTAEGEQERQVVKASWTLQRIIVVKRKALRLLEGSYWRVAATEDAVHIISGRERLIAR